MKRNKKQLYEPTRPGQRAWFETAADDEGDYPEEGHGCNVMPCRYARKSKFSKVLGPLEYVGKTLTQTGGNRFAWVYTGGWVPEGTFVKAIRVWDRWWADASCLAVMSLRKYSNAAPPIRQWFKRNFYRVRVDSNQDIYAIADNDQYKLGFDDRESSEDGHSIYKYSAAGEKLLSAPFVRLGGREDVLLGGPYNFDLDSSDNLYIVGTDKNTSTLGVLEKYDSDLNQVWQYSDQGANPSPSVFVSSLGVNTNSVKVTDDFVYVAGDYNHLTEVSGYPIKQFNHDGDLLKDFNPYIFESGVIYSIDVDADGFIYAGGTFSDRVTDPGNLFKIDPDTPNSSRREVVWSYELDDNFLNGITAVKVIGDHVYVASQRNGVIKLTLDGAVVWKIDATKLANPNAIDSDDDGNIYVTGGPDGSGSLGRTGVFNTWKIDPDGNIIFKHDVFSYQYDIAVNKSTQEFYTVGEPAEDYC